MADPFNLDLAFQTASLLRSLAIDGESNLSSSPLASLPLSHLEPLARLAFAQDSTNISPESVVDLLSDLLEVQPLTLAVAERFRPLLPVLLARWMDRTRGGRDEWIRRVVAATSLAQGVEQVWP